MSSARRDGRCAMSDAFYLDTSVILRTVFEKGLSPELETKILEARFLTTSRLSSVEGSRALIRASHMGRMSPTALADAERGFDAILARCGFWELTRDICESARMIAPTKVLRSLDALHLATFVTARKRVADLQLLTVDQRLQEAADTV